MVIPSRIKRVILYALITFVAGCASIFEEEPQTRTGQPYSGHIDAAEAALAEADVETAGNELKLALQADPLNPKAHYLLGSLLASQGMEDQAIIGFQRAAMINPNHRESLHNLGTLMLRRGEAVPAAEILEAAVVADPDYIPPYNSLAKAYYQAGLPELAIATYEEVLRRDTVNPVAGQNLALLLAAAEAKPSNSLVKKDISILDAAGEDKEQKTPEKEAEKPPAPAAKSGDKKDAPKPSETKKAPAKKAVSPNLDSLRELLGELPYVQAEENGSLIFLTGWTRGDKERELLDRILTRWPDVLDLTGTDTADPLRMLEVDAVLFIVIGFKNESIGFNFLRLIDLSYSFFKNTTGSFMDEMTGLQAPGFGDKIKIPSSGSLLIASVDYDVNIANAVDERVAVLARPHLTTMNGTPASFHAGGEWVFRVSGVEKGDIKPYPFGIQVSVTPTLLRTPGEDGEPRVHLDIEAERKSVLEVLTASASDEDVVFDTLAVKSQAVLGLDETLILSGLNQKESRTSDSGVPVVMDIPVVKYFFSQKLTVETNTAVIILLTPRDPAYVGAENRRSLNAFVEMRRAFVKADQGTQQDMLAFQRRYPDWQQLAPNRFASHFFLLESSDVYRRVSGEDLIDEDLDLHLLHRIDSREDFKEQAEREH